MIPEAGHLTLGYFNDYFKADVRIATLKRVVASGCSSPPKLELLGTSGGTVDSALSQATLYSNRIIRISACSTGRVGFRMTGQAGGGSLPIMSFLSTGKEIARIQTTPTEQKILMPVNGSVEMKLLNPYAKLVGDRNLNIRKVQFNGN